MPHTCCTFCWFSARFSFLTSRELQLSFSEPLPNFQLLLWCCRLRFYQRIYLFQLRPTPAAVFHHVYEQDLKCIFQISSKWEELQLKACSVFDAICFCGYSGLSFFVSVWLCMIFLLALCFVRDCDVTDCCQAEFIFSKKVNLGLQTNAGCCSRVASLFNIYPTENSKHFPWHCLLDC